MMYSLLRKILFALAPETAHALTLNGLSLAERTGFSGLLAPRPHDPIEVMGLSFPNRVGLAAGLDKDGAYVDALGALGFGHIEVGTVTPRPQPGNPQPRLFRLPAAQALVNRMGFNNAGVEALVANVRRAQFARRGGILGINIGKNADTPIEKAAEDYLLCLEKVYADAHYVTINVSSPNTKNLRELQKDAALDALLAALKGVREKLADQHGRHVPILLKIAPDLGDGEIFAIADALRRHRMDGAIVANTTLSRAGVEGLPHAQETGGLSGAPEFRLATSVLGKLAAALKGELPLIGVGGILKGEDARAKIAAGASLVQVYTGLIYRGPRIVREVAEALRERSA
ncbi:MAG: quinone-dependent dihydroorotate dehydrogenase [Zoogloeaceae bacterium]|jgi:dihydroorotate dehydrogenase|nr:quinone-dependent dihydroorotate dehydrogenase [Zoogloeaceae bacterium]